MSIVQPMSIYIVFSGLVGAVLSTIGAYFLTRHRDAAGRRRAFRAYVRSVLCELEAMDFTKDAVKAGNPYFLYDWQKAIVPGVRTECARIMEDICSARASKLESLLMDFSRQGHRDVEPFESLRYETKREQLREILTKMIDHAK